MLSPVTRLFPAALLAVAAAGCGDKIGDACSISSECSSQGDRLCDVTSPGGYCTIVGCDFDTCPDDSVCIRFFGVTNTGRPCDPQTEDRETDDCSPDELCSLAETCVPRTAETRFCMATCGDNGDCRDRYECRTLELMQLHGGEPVPAPGEAVGDDPQPFCAAAPVEG
jgi:hypothetical protein